MVSYSEGDPGLYEDYYTSLKLFIEKSLDIHKVILVVSRLKDLLWVLIQAHSSLGCVNFCHMTHITPTLHVLYVV